MKGKLTYRTEKMVPLNESSTDSGFYLFEEIKKDLIKQI